MFRAVITMLLVSLLAYPIETSQKKRPAKKPPQASNTKHDALPFAMPIEVRIGYHRSTEEAVFLTLKNLGTRLSIKSVDVIVLVLDPIRLTRIDDYPLDFEFAIPIKPGQIGESVVLKSESFILKAKDLTPARCKEYESGTDASTFIPGTCIRGNDILGVLISSITYTDGSAWTPPRKN